jgi:hypothetical protein
MFFQETTPDTSGYMIAGYVIAFIVMGLYVASIYLRNRSLHQDLTVLEEMDKPAQPVQERSNGRARKTPARSENHKSPSPVTKRSKQK